MSKFWGVKRVETLSFGLLSGSGTHPLWTLIRSLYFASGLGCRIQYDNAAWQGTGRGRAP